MLPAYIGEPFAPDAPAGRGITLTDERERINVLILKLDCVESTIGFIWRRMAAGSRALHRLIQPAAYHAA